MQTFLPLPNFHESAASLDWKRLGKQRVENYQIMCRLLGYRVGNTKKAIPTGQERTVYYDEDGVELNEEDPQWKFQLASHVETEPIYRTVELGPEHWVLDLLLSNAWQNHPAVRMWRGYESALLSYQEAICDEWVQSRGFADRTLGITRWLFDQSGPKRSRFDCLPPWFGDIDFHISHQSNLIRKDPAYYGPQFPGVPDNLDYIWPV